MYGIQVKIIDNKVKIRGKTQTFEKESQILKCVSQFYEKKSNFWETVTNGGIEI